MKKSVLRILNLKGVFMGAVLLLLALCIYAFVLIQNLVTASQMVNHVNQTTLSLQKIAFYITDAETNQRGFLLTGDSVLLKRKEYACKMLNTELENLNKQIGSDQSQLNSFQMLHQDIDEKLTSMKKVLESYSPIETNLPLRMNILEGIQKMDHIKNSLSQMEAEQQALLKERTYKFQQTSLLTPLFTTLLMIISILLLLSSYIKINKELKNSNSLQTQLQDQNTKLEERTLFAENILNASVANVQVFDSDMRLITLNEKAEKLYGKNRNSMIGKHVMDLIPNFQQSAAYEAMSKALKGEMIHYKEYLSNYNGRYYESFYIPLKKAGEIWAVMISAHDVSDLVEMTEMLKRKNDELAERNDFVETLLNSSVDIIFVVDKELRYISLNKKAIEVYSPFGSVIGRTIAEVNPLATQSVVYGDILKAVKGELVHRDKFKSITTENFYKADMVPLTRENEVYAVMVVLHNITDVLLTQNQLKRSENRYQLMVGEVENYAILFLNTEGVIENWNKGAERIQGYTEEEIIGKNFSIFFTEEDLENHLPEKILIKAVEEQKAVYEGWRIRKDRSKFWASVSITTLYDEDKKLIGFSKVTRDLTERKVADEKIRQHAEELERKNKSLEIMNQELTAFAYVSSHDLQEPLRKIQTFSSRIMDKEYKVLSESGQDYFRRIQKATARMQNLILDLLAYSRATTDERKFETTDVTMIFDDVKDDFKELIKDKSAAIESVPLHQAVVIPFQFRQLLHNLISNSLKFTRPGSNPLINIKSEKRKGAELNEEKLKPGKMYYHLTFSDNGVGFDSQYSERIFEVFQRLHSRQEYEGTGIGLAIVKKIVDNHNGVITVFSEINKGTTFHIYLPA